MALTSASRVVVESTATLWTGPEPTWNWKVPGPVATVSELAASPMLEVAVEPWASWMTFRVTAPFWAPAPAAAVTTLSSLEAACWTSTPLVVLSVRAAVPSAERSPASVPIEDCVAWTAASWFWSSVTGALAAATSWLMIWLVSRPVARPPTVTNPALAMVSPLPDGSGNGRGGARCRAPPAGVRSRYPSSLSARFGSWFACASTAAPACWSTSLLARFALSAATSASRMRPSASWKFSWATWRFEIAVRSRLSTAPIEPRVCATWAMPEVRKASADCAAACVETAMLPAVTPRMPETDLQRDRRAGAQQLHAVEDRGRRDAVDLREQRGELLLDGAALGVAHRAGGGLGRELAQPRENVGVGAERLLADGERGEAVVGVADGLPRDPLVALEPVGDRQPGRIVGCLVDAKARGQPPDGLVEASLRLVEVELGVQRRDVGVDVQCHGTVSSLGFRAAGLRALPGGRSQDSIGICAMNLNPPRRGLRPRARPPW